jgi:hypothetical protein
VTAVASARRSVEAEFRLRIAPHISEHSRLPCTLVVLQTAKAFASFRYGLDVEEYVEGTTLHLKVLGLRAPQLDLPSSGPAEFRKEYTGWSGIRHVVVHGLDGSSTMVRVRVGADGISLLEPVAGGIVAVDVPATP